MTRDRPLDYSDRDEDVLAVDIGRTVLEAHRTASRIISAARREAEGLVPPAHHVSQVRDPGHKQVVLDRLLELVGELDRVEEELQTRRKQMVDYLDRYVAGRPTDR